MLPLVYDELRRLARAFLARERSGHTLQATALVHEAYLRLVDQRQVDWTNRAQFVGVAAVMMRRILVNHARDRAADKRGGEAERVSLSLADAIGEAPSVDLIALHDALDALADDRCAQEPRRRAQVLRRSDDRGDRRGHGAVAGHDRTRVELLARLALRRARWRRFLSGNGRREMDPDRWRRINDIFQDDHRAHRGRPPSVPRRRLRR